MVSQGLLFAFARLGGLMLWVSDVGLLFCRPHPDPSPHLLASCRLQQHHCVEQTLVLGLDVKVSELGLNLV